MNRQLSPAEIAKRFGVSVKALRVYEERGLLSPLRVNSGSTRSSWRTYGPDRVATLHQIIALKHLGLPLARIREILTASDTLPKVLALQEQALTKDRDRIDQSLALIRAARAKLATGEPLSIDDLATLTTETVMPSLTDEELKAIFTPFKLKHFTSDETDALADWKATHESTVEEVRALTKRTLELMVVGDVTSSEAMSLAKRWRDLKKRMFDSDPAIIALAPKMKDILGDAMADAQTAPKLARAVDMHAFIAKIFATQKEQDAG